MPLPDLQRVGFDVVSRACAPHFECSPLSCNGFAAEAGANESCLLDSLDAAVSCAERWAAEPPEPGPYYVVEVLRRCLTL